MGKKCLSLLLAVIMLLSALSLSAFAVESATEGDFEYLLTENGAKIVAVNTEESIINIPDTLGGEPVTAFDEALFDGKTISDISLPASLSDIPASVLSNEVKIYGFEDSAAKAFAETNGNVFFSLGATSAYNTYVGKTTALTIPENALLKTTGNALSVSSASVKALAEGEEKLNLLLENGILGILTFKIAAAPEAIGNLPKVINLYVSDSYAKFAPQITNGNYEGSFRYAIADTKIASINSTSGKITALKPGSTTVTVRFENAVSALVPLNVGLAPKDFALNQKELLLGVKEPATLTWTLGENQLYKKLTFTSSNTAVATVNTKGDITAKAVGIATITATLDNGKTDTCLVTVAAAPTSIKLAKSSINLGVGESVKFKASVNAGAVCSNYLWRSSDTSIFTVDGEGNVYAKKAGSAKLYAYTYNYKSKNPYIRASAVINVKKAPSSVTFNKTNLVLGVGESFDLNCVLPANTASYKTSVSMEDKSIAVNGAGMVITAKELGTTNFTLTTYNGKTATCKITVKPAPEKVACKPTSMKLSLKQTYQLAPYVNKGAVCSSYIYKTSNKKVCTVNKNGLITVKDYGSCYIHIYTYNHTSKQPITCKVKIQVGYITNKLASYTTYFDRYYYGKSQNLKMACKYINGKTDGYILQPGEVFSYNSAVGPRTSARGFVDAKVIAGGDYVDGIGGGICQGATTIFNAALLGNCKIVERHCHNLKSSYCPVGRDATVSWGSQDFKFKNNFNTPIRIKMNYSSGGSINCSIYTLKKLKLPKITLPVSYSGGAYYLKRYANGKLNYSAVSRYVK